MMYCTVCVLQELIEVMLIPQANVDQFVPTCAVDANSPSCDTNVAFSIMLGKDKKSQQIVVNP